MERVIISLSNGMPPTWHQNYYLNHCSELDPDKQTLWNVHQNTSFSFKKIHFIMSISAILFRLQCVNSSPPNAAHMHHWNGSALVQVMACCLFGTKPLPASMLAYCQLDSWEQILGNSNRNSINFIQEKYIWNCRLPKWQPFCPGGDELTGFQVSRVDFLQVPSTVTSHSAQPHKGSKVHYIQHEAMIQTHKF